MKKILIRAMAVAISLTAVSGNCVAMLPRRNKQDEDMWRRIAVTVKDFSEGQKISTKKLLSLISPELEKRCDKRVDLYRVILRCFPKLEPPRGIKRDLQRVPDRLLKWFYDNREMILENLEVLKVNYNKNKYQAVNQRRENQLPPIQGLMSSRDIEELSQWWQDFGFDPTMVS